MRIPMLQRGQSRAQRALFAIARRWAERIPGPVLVFSYKQKFFGKHFVRLLQYSLREARHWSLGEVELFATFVSNQNECVYCTGDHTAVAVETLGADAQLAAILDDYMSAELEPRLETTLTFLAKLTREPWAVTPDDIAPMREAGLSDEAIEEAIRVCLCLNVIDRIADAFDFEVAGGRHLEAIVKMLTVAGYRLASIPG